MPKYKYTYQDWVEGRLESSSLLIKLRYLKELSVEDYEKIDDLQLKAFAFLVDAWLMGDIDDFLSLYKNSFTKPHNLSRYIRSTEEQIKEFIKENPKVYMQTMNEYTGYIELTYQQIQLIYNDSFDTTTLFAEGKALEIVRMLKLLDWLLWFQQKEIEKAEKLNQDYYLRATTNSNESIVKHRATSYTWLGNDDDLPKLYQRLIDAKLIDNATKQEQFEAVFTAKPLQAIEPIVWIGAKSLLAYFLYSVYTNKKIPTNTNVWSVAGKCFAGANSLAQSKTNYENTNRGMPKQSEVIDEILNAL